MLIAWTTLAQRGDAEQLAGQVIALRLAACAQIDGPIVSHYHWQDQAQRAEEFRLTFKLLPHQSAPLEDFILHRHPYETPQWIVVAAEHVGEKYLSWARANSSSAPL